MSPAESVFTPPVDFCETGAIFLASPGRVYYFLYHECALQLFEKNPSIGSQFPRPAPRFSRKMPPAYFCQDFYLGQTGMKSAVKRFRN